MPTVLLCAVAAYFLIFEFNLNFKFTTNFSAKPLPRLWRIAVVTCWLFFIFCSCAAARHTLLQF